MPVNDNDSKQCRNSNEKTPYGGFSSQTSSQDAAREAVRLLADLGVTDPLEAMRLGALAMVRRSIAAAEQRGRASGRYVRAIVLNGGPWSDDNSASAMIREIRQNREAA